MKVKLYFAAFQCIVLIFAVNMSYGQFASTYVNIKHNYSINLPETFKVTELPSHEECDTLRAVNNDNCMIDIIVRNDKIYRGITANQLSHRSFMPDLKIKFKNVKFAENDFTDISGIPAMYMKVEYKNEIDEEGFVSQYVMLRGEKIFIIRVSAPSNIFDTFIKEISGYIYSFKFTEGDNKGIYVNSKHNFMITFPEGWLFDKLSFPVQANNSRGSSIFIDIIKNDGFKDYTARDLDLDLLMEAYKEKFPSIVLITRKNTQINDVPALYAKYKWQQANSGKDEYYYVHHYYIIRNGLLYVIQGIVSDKNSVKDELPILKSCETFEFTK